MSDDDDNGSVVPDKITFRLDHASRRMVENVMRTSGLKASAAIRLLITMGAAREDKLEMAFKQAAWRDAVLRASAALQKGLQETVYKTFNEEGDQK